jgi:hypothetical protein
MTTTKDNTGDMDRMDVLSIVQNQISPLVPLSINSSRSTSSVVVSYIHAVFVSMQSAETADIAPSVRLLLLHSNDLVNGWRNSIT